MNVRLIKLSCLVDDDDEEDDDDVSDCDDDEECDEEVGISALQQSGDLEDDEEDYVPGS